MGCTRSTASDPVRDALVRACSPAALARHDPDEEVKAMTAQIESEVSVWNKTMGEAAIAVVAGKERGNEGK